MAKTSEVLDKAFQKSGSSAMRLIAKASNIGLMMVKTEKRWGN